MAGTISTEGGTVDAPLGMGINGGSTIERRSITEGASNWTNRVVPRRIRSSRSPEYGDRSLPQSIVLSRVDKGFGEVRVIDSISLAIPGKARLALIGPSGCGKSTLLRLIAGLLPFDGGTIDVGDQREATTRLAMCALMPQQDLLLPWRSALDNACLALENRGVPRREARRRAEPLFERFGLGSFESSLPSQLSGGMRQRVSFLRTLMADKGVMLLDEPFGALDAITRAEMQDWLSAALDEAPRTVLLVTHDVEEALLLCDTVVVMSTRPARLLHCVQVDVPKSRPRADTVSDPHFVLLKHDILKALAK
jgi:ABC-type nitrate/sulfonate/bicarbonate transport system ATPase subunit